MNRKAFQIFPTAKQSRLMLWALVFCLLGLVLPGARAQQALYQNTSINQYYLPTTQGQLPPPTIDAFAFDNESTFSVSFNVLGNKAALYETSDTLFITNGDNGIMIANCPISTNLLTQNFENYDSYGAGFQFDNKTKHGRFPADTFYNSGTIRCDSLQDGNNTFQLNQLGFFFNLFNPIVGLFSVGTCNVIATNIYNPGNFVLGSDSLLQFTGQNVDLSRSSLTIEPALQPFFNINNFFGVFFTTGNSSVTVNSTGAVGTDTNGDWNPGGPGFTTTGTLYQQALSANSAFSSYPATLALSNSLSYFSGYEITPTNWVISAVFVQNNSPNAPYNVYIDPPGTVSILDPFGYDGQAHVEWVGTYQDPSSGDTFTNYLYLTDDYVQGSQTNNFVYPGPLNNGYPYNFSFATSTSELLTGQPQIQSGFQNVYADQSITNPYAYMNGQVIASTISTNVSSSNPFGGVTNVVGRIQVSASHELNLNNAVITGLNYLSIQATNQFDGSAGSFIAAPFSDINLGVTNGNLSVTNLLISNIPNWNGPIQAWSTRWTNLFPGSTNIIVDYRVLLVYSQFSPTTQPFVQNLKLTTGTNLFISDVLNVYSSFFTDAQNLTVTTNGYGFGATSLVGQLNGLFPGNMGPQQWPNLRNVTNNGSITALNSLIFTNLFATSGTNRGIYGSFINNGTISDQGTFITATNFFCNGTIANGLNGMALVAQTATFSNAYVYAGGAAGITASNLVLTNLNLQSLTLKLNPATLITDEFTNGPGATNSSFWTVGRTNATGGEGFSLLNNPANGDLLGTTITNICPPSNKLDANFWAAHDFGVANRGYTNNAAVGHLILDVLGNSSQISFTGTGTSNALYVDCLEFRDYATNGINFSYDFSNWVSINPNLVIYFAQAYINGVSVAEKINNASLYNGKNGGVVSNNVVVKPGRLRWVPTYVGYFSSTNYVVNGVTNTFNAALAVSKIIDSNGNGLANANDTSPFFTAGEINFSLTVTNLPTPRALITWDTVPFATNFLYYTSSLLTNNWQLFTNFNSVSTTGPSYPVTVSDTNRASGIRFYKVVVKPWLTYPY